MREIAIEGERRGRETERERKKETERESERGRKKEWPKSSQWKISVPSSHPTSRHAWLHLEQPPPSKFVVQTGAKIFWRRGFSARIPEPGKGEKVFPAPLRVKKRPSVKLTAQEFAGAQSVGSCVTKSKMAGKRVLRDSKSSLWSNRESVFRVFDFALFHSLFRSES